MSVACCGGHTFVPEQRLQFAEVSALFVEQQIRRTVTQSVCGDDRNTGRAARGCQATGLTPQRYLMYHSDFRKWLWKSEMC